MVTRDGTLYAGLESLIHLKGESVFSKQVYIPSQHSLLFSLKGN